MKVTFWGVLGFPADAPLTCAGAQQEGRDGASHSGNTTCLEVRTDAGNLVVLDGGSGLPLEESFTEFDYEGTRIRWQLTSPWNGK